MRSHRSALREETAIKDFIKSAFRLLSRYWRSEERVAAWISLATLVVIELILAYILAKLTFYYGDMMDALKEKDVDTFSRVGLTYLGFVLIVVFFNMTEILVRGYLIVNWRRWLTGKLAGRYMDGKLYNQMELKDYQCDNPDQRISLRMVDSSTDLCDETLELGVSFIKNFARLWAFGVALWVASGTLEFSISDIDVRIPGYMFWASMLYAGFVTWAVHKVGHPLTRLINRQLEVEADFRFQMIRIREYAESIALIQGAENEERRMRNLFSAVWQNFMQQLRYKVPLIGVQAFMGRMTNIFPTLMSIPGYITGTITFGEIFQINAAFAAVTMVLEWFALSYQKLVTWKASVDRVLLLELTLNLASDESGASGFCSRSSGSGNFQVNGLDIRLPGGRALLENAEFEIAKGANTLVTGKSGSGKSTLFRALSGLWVWGKGDIARPDGKVMFLPQRIYLPIGTLRAVLCYPDETAAYDEQRIVEVLKQCQLAHLVARLDDEDNWSRVLSGGEQQRIGFVRALLGQPDWLFLDEATAALDLATEAKLYGVLETELPETTIVSIAHRESLRRYHDQQLTLDPDSRTVSMTPLPAGAAS